MATNSDWMPGSRNVQLEMAKNWHELLQQKGKLWFIPEITIDEFNVAINVAGVELSISPALRNAVSNARLRMAFKTLTSMMRDIKKRFFYNPPLAESDIVALGLKPKDSTPTSVLVPTGQAEARIAFPGRIRLMVHIKPVEGTQADPRTYYGCRIYYGIYTADETLPANGKDLRESLFTRRKKELFTFQPEDAGKAAYFCVRYENSKGKAGPWGPMSSANIP